MQQVRAIIVAYGDGRVIGDRGRIPWLGRMPADMRRVRELTTGQAIIMGSRTFASLGQPLPGRQNIVLAGADFTADGVEVAHNFDEAFALVAPGRTAFIFGGASVYAQALEQDLADVIYATEIHGEFSGDVFFPEVPNDRWQEAERQDFPADEQNAYPYSFVKYERRKNV
ncbi:dihydrofolate reductase [Candidatus Saccharibacteria bacterium]|nr:dihydrofolate reductase [Candidatus Saccharibacteria bacterium]